MALTPRDRRALMILGIVAGVALVAFLLLKLLGGGGGEQAAPPPTGTTGPTTAPSPSPSASPTPTPRETLPPGTLAGARDPFSIPPVLSPTPSGSVSPSPSATGSPSGTGSPSPSGTGSPSPSGTGSPSPSPSNESSTTIGGHDVTLLDIFGGGTKAQVEVDGTVYTVEEGSTFDDNFKLVNIDGDCARFTWGDQGFTLCLNPQK